MPGFEEFLKMPATGPTYTDLAREVDRLKADNAALVDALRNAALALSRAYMPNAAGRAMCVADAPHPGTAILDEMERLKQTVKTLNRRDGEIRQQAILDFAHELAEMEPAARNAAIRRIVDSHGDKP